MKPSLHPLLTTALLAVAVLTPASAQSIGRIRKSLDKATGGATQPATASGTASAQAATQATAIQAQNAAAEAAANRRNKAAQVGVDDRVIAFLKQRIEDGSADAPADLAKRYEEGKGVAADPAEARRLYTLAAERGNEEAKTWLQNNPEAEKPAGEKVAAEAEAPSTPKDPAPAAAPKPQP